MSQTYEDLYRMRSGKAKDREMADICFELLTAIVPNSMVLDPDRLAPDACLHDDLGMDEIDAVEVAIAVNDRWGVDIDSDALWLRRSQRTFQVIITVMDLAEAVVADGDFQSDERASRDPAFARTLAQVRACLA